MNFVTSMLPNQASNGVFAQGNAAKVYYPWTVTFRLSLAPFISPWVSEDGRFIAQKGFTRFTKLPLPCNSVHANSYTKTKPKNFSSIDILFLVVPIRELHETCTKHSKRWKWPTFLSWLQFQQSQRRFQLNGSRRCVLLTVPACIILWTTHITKHFKQNILISHSGNKTSSLQTIVKKSCHFFFHLDNISRVFCL